MLMFSMVVSQYSQQGAELRSEIVFRASLSDMATTMVVRSIHGPYHKTPLNPDPCWWFYSGTVRLSSSSAKSYQIIHKPNTELRQKVPVCGATVSLRRKLAELCLNMF